MWRFFRSISTSATLCHTREPVVWKSHSQCALHIRVRVCAKDAETFLAALGLWARLWNSIDCSDRN